MLFKNKTNTSLGSLWDTLKFYHVYVYESSSSTLSFCFWNCVDSRWVVDPHIFLYKELLKEHAPHWCRAMLSLNFLEPRKWYGGGKWRDCMKQKGKWDRWRKKQNKVLMYVRNANSKTMGILHFTTQPTSYQLFF